MPPTTPRFKSGDRVYYAALGRHGTVRTLINANDPADLRQQGPRYEVSFGHRDNLWSVRDVSLASRKPRPLRAATSAQKS